MRRESIAGQRRFLDEPRLHRVGSTFGKTEVVSVVTFRIGMAIDSDLPFCFLTDDGRGLLESVLSLFGECRLVEIEQHIGRHRFESPSWTRGFAGLSFCRPNPSAWETAGLWPSGKPNSPLSETARLTCPPAAARCKCPRFPKWPPTQRASAECARVSLESITG